MIKYLIMDIDGTLTDGKIYMGSSGEAMKAFSVKDGYSIDFILKPNGIVPVVITARNSSIVQNRCNELGITEVYQGKMDKLEILKEIVGVSNFGTCAYFGDDILDHKCMAPIKHAGGIVGCPSDAVSEIQAISDYVCVRRAGEGALREFSEWLVKLRFDDIEIKKRVNYAVQYFKQLTNPEKNIGNTIIVNEYFYYSVQSYLTRSENECRLESHRKNIDIQIIVSGNEDMDIVDTARLVQQYPYNEKDDVIIWKDPVRMARITLHTGSIIVLYPENAHKGAISDSNPVQVVKIVGKVSTAI